MRGGGPETPGVRVTSTEGGAVSRQGSRGHRNIFGICHGLWGAEPAESSQPHLPPSLRAAPFSLRHPRSGGLQGDKGSGDLSGSFQGRGLGGRELWPLGRDCEAAGGLEGTVRVTGFWRGDPQAPQVPVISGGEEQEGWGRSWGGWGGWDPRVGRWGAGGPAPSSGNHRSVLGGRQQAPSKLGGRDGPPHLCLPAPS